MNQGSIQWPAWIAYVREDGASDLQRNRVDLCGWPHRPMDESFCLGPYLRERMRS
jgi:hypothetical protein